MHWYYIDISTPDFPGLHAVAGGGYRSLRPTPASHPHLRLEECMTSIPKVNPGDAVFWHCDVIHAIEIEHTGSGDSAGKHYLFLVQCQCSELTLRKISDVHSGRSFDASKPKIY